MIVCTYVPRTVVCVLLCLLVHDYNYVDVTMCDTKDTCSCSLEATAGHCSFHVDLCRCLGSRCVLQPLVGLDCTAQYTPPISNVLNNLWKPNSSWSLSLQLKRKTEKTLKCFFYNLITCWDPCFFTTWALRSRLRFSYVISSNVVVGVAQLATQENGAREDYLQHGLQKDLHLVRVYSGRSSYLWASVWTKHGHSMGEN